jgi:hypothetical protein
MPKIAIKNLGYIQSIKLEHSSGVIDGSKIAEALQSVAIPIQNSASYLAQDVSGTPAVPPLISALQAQHCGKGLVDLAITDNSSGLQQAVGYWIEYSNDGFKTSRPQFIGGARNHLMTLPNGRWQFRAFSQYQTAGSPNTPVAAPGTLLINDSTAGDTILFPSQGSGTGRPGEQGTGAGKTVSRV